MHPYYAGNRGGFNRFPGFNNHDRFMMAQQQHQQQQMASPFRSRGGLYHGGPDFGRYDIMEQRRLIQQRIEMEQRLNQQPPHLPHPPRLDPTFRDIVDRDWHNERPASHQKRDDFNRGNVEKSPTVGGGDAGSKDPGDSSQDKSQSLKTRGEDEDLRENMDDKEHSETNDRDRDSDIRRKDHDLRNQDSDQRQQSQQIEEPPSVETPSNITAEPEEVPSPSRSPPSAEKVISNEQQQPASRTDEDFRKNEPKIDETAPKPQRDWARDERERKERLIYNRGLQKKPENTRITPGMKKFDLVGSILEQSQKKKVTVARLSEKRINPVGDRCFPGESRTVVDLEKPSPEPEKDGQAKYDPFEPNVPSPLPTSTSPPPPEFSLADIIEQFSDNEVIDLKKLYSLRTFEVTDDMQADALKEIIRLLSTSLIQYEMSLVPLDLKQLVKEMILID